MYDKLLTKYRRVYRNIPINDLRKITQRVKTTILNEESEGKCFTWNEVDVLYPNFIKAHIRHTQTGYDDILRKGCDKSWARLQVRRFVNDKANYWMRK